MDTAPGPMRVRGSLQPDCTLPGIRVRKEGTAMWVKPKAKIIDVCAEVTGYACQK